MDWDLIDEIKKGRGEALGDFINAVSTSSGLLVMSLGLVFYTNYKLHLNISKKI